MLSIFSRKKQNFLLNSLPMMTVSERCVWWIGFMHDLASIEREGIRQFPQIKILDRFLSFSV